MASTMHMEAYARSSPRLALGRPAYTHPSAAAPMSTAKTACGAGVPPPIAGTPRYHTASAPTSAAWAVAIVRSLDLVSASRLYLSSIVWR